MKTLAASTLLAAIALSAGCNRQDADCLSRISQKVNRHARRGAGDIGQRFEVSWPGARKEPTLQEKVQERLRWENTLADVTIEVLVKDKEVELKGTVNNALQRQRAVELSDTVAGVAKTIDSLTVREEEAAK